MQDWTKKITTKMMTKTFKIYKNITNGCVYIENIIILKIIHGKVANVYCTWLWNVKGWSPRATWLWHGISLYNNIIYFGCSSEHHLTWFQNWEHVSKQLFEVTNPIHALSSSNSRILLDSPHLKLGASTACQILASMSLLGAIKKPQAT